MTLSQIVALIIGAIILIIVIAYLLINQKQKVMEWLKYAVVEAEKALGTGTGQLKLRQVYDWFVEQFPVIAAFLPFKVFSAWVDVALETMRQWLEENTSVKAYISGDNA